MLELALKLHLSSAQMERAGCADTTLLNGTLRLAFLPPAVCCVQVEQSYALIPMEQQFASIFAVLRRHAAETPGGWERGAAEQKVRRCEGQKV